MSVFLRLLPATALCLTLGACLQIHAAQSFTVGTFNLENYLDAPTAGRKPKPDASKAVIRASLLQLNADVLALQEIGSASALEELRSSLRIAGLDYPHWEFVSGPDTNIHLAILSRFPIEARRPHTNEVFLLHRRRFRVSRGIADLDVKVNARYKFTLLSAHLKSRRTVPGADQAEVREQEALILRRFVDERLRTDPDANLVVLGDFNDHRNSPPIRVLIGRGTRALFDTRPGERTADNPPVSDQRLPLRTVAWTHYYAIEETHSRVDYILVSRGMAREWDRTGTFVLSTPNWGVASDHRPLVARFVAEDK